MKQHPKKKNPTQKPQKKETKIHTASMVYIVYICNL